jgi:hypothetical protein
LLPFWHFRLSSEASFLNFAVFWGASVMRLNLTFPVPPVVLHYRYFYVQSQLCFTGR